MSTATAKTEKPFTPVAFWLANPQLQLKIKVPGTRRYLKFNNGKLVAKSQQEYDLIKASGQAYEDDAFEADAPHEVTGYNPRSAKAYVAHQKFVPQG